MASSVVLNLALLVSLLSNLKSKLSPCLKAPIGYDLLTICNCWYLYVASEAIVVKSSNLTFLTMVPPFNIIALNSKFGEVSAKRANAFTSRLLTSTITFGKLISVVIKIPS